MSKAMDALELVWRIMCDGGDTDIEACAAACAILRDYITTTDAERAAFEELEASVCPEDVGFDEYIKVLQKHRDGSAARIKELEEQVAAYAAVPVGMQFMNDPGMLERSWPIDFPGENGNYMCICSTCGEHFIGHKRRLTCRKCDTAALSGARKVGL